MKKLLYIIASIELAIGVSIVSSIVINVVVPGAHYGLTVLATIGGCAIVHGTIALCKTWEC